MHMLFTKDAQCLAMQIQILTGIVFSSTWRHPYNLATAWKFLRSEAIIVLPIPDADSAHLEGSRKQYADRSIDFVNAKLVHFFRKVVIFCHLHHRAQRF